MKIRLVNMSLDQARGLLKELSIWCTTGAPEVQSYYATRYDSYPKEIFQGLERTDGENTEVMEADRIYEAINVVLSSVNAASSKQKWISFYDKPTDSWTIPRRTNYYDAIKSVGVHKIDDYDKHYSIIMEFNKSIDDTDYILYKMKSQFGKECESNGRDSSAVH